MRGMTEATPAISMSPMHSIMAKSSRALRCSRASRRSRNLRKVSIICR